MIEFLIFILIYIQLPGMFLLSCLNFKPKSPAVTLLTGFFAGFGVLLLEYFDFSALGWVKGIIFISPVLVIAGCKKIYSALRELAAQLKNNLFYVAVFATMFVAVALAVWSFEGAYCQPVNGYYYPYVDLLWNASNTANLAAGYPLKDPQFAGLVVNYHCYHEIFYACHEIVFGTAAYDTYAWDATLLMGWTIAISVAALFEHPGHDRRTKVLYLLKALSFFACGSMMTCLISRNEGFGSKFNFYFLTSEGGAGLAIAGSIAVFVVLREALRTKVGYRELTLVALVAFACGAIKGPATLVILAAFVGTVLLKCLAERKIDINLIKIFVAYALPSILVLLVVVDVAGNVYTENGSVISVIYSWMNSGIHKFMEPYDKAIPIRLLGYVLVVFAFYGPMILLWLVGFVRDAIGIFSGKKELSADCYIAYGATIVACGGVLFTFQISSSHWQFMIAGVPMMLYGAWTNAEEYLTKGFALKKWATVMAVAFALGMGIFSDVMDVRANMTKYERFVTGESFNVLNSISLAEKEGCEWIRDNTATDSVIAVDRRYIGDENVVASDRYFYYTAFMERSAFVGGSFYRSGITPDELEKRIATNKAIYSSSGAELEQLLRDNGIDYIIVSKALKTEFEPESDMVQAVFDNEGMTIYQFND
ncbi:MAG: hypothetical protein HUJ98_06410 [Bacteroidaceae bacterium]|nr:hypothetical protein [Bacteroidaceae bacterium]